MSSSSSALLLPCPAGPLLTRSGDRLCPLVGTGAMLQARTFPNCYHPFWGSTSLAPVACNGLILISASSRMQASCAAVAIMHFIFALLVGPSFGTQPILWSCPSLTWLFWGGQGEARHLFMVEKPSLRYRLLACSKVSVRHFPKQSLLSLMDKLKRILECEILREIYSVSPQWKWICA